MRALHQKTWMDELRSLFPVAEEFELAKAIYSFEDDYHDDKTPDESYNQFDEWASADA